MQKWRKWEAATELDWLLALRRESVIAPLAAQSKVGLRRVDEAALQLGLRRSVIYDLLKRYRRRSQTSSLLPGKRGREPEVPVLKEVREQLLSSCIQDFYLQPERPRLAALVLEVQRRWLQLRCERVRVRTYDCVSRPGLKTTTIRPSETTKISVSPNGRDRADTTETYQRY
jgi:putative transposase